MYHYFHNPQYYGYYDQSIVNGYTAHRQISVQDAMNIALSVIPGRVVKIDLDQENGIWVYEVDIITSQGVKYTVEVEINTGTVLKVETD